MFVDFRADALEEVRYRISYSLFLWVAFVVEAERSSGKVLEITEIFTLVWHNIESSKRRLEDETNLAQVILVVP